MKKLLLLTDFSEASRHALDYARSFFSDTVADFHLMCVTPSESTAAYNPIYCHETSRTAYADQLNDMLTQLRREATTDWHTYRSSVCPGAWLDVVGKSLDMEPYDFVVMGSQKDGTITLFDHSAVALTRQLKANVIVVPVNSPTGETRRVVLATDFARLKNAKLLSPLKELVTLKGADLTLLSVDVPNKNAIRVEKELHIRKFLAPIEPIVSHLRGTTASEGIDTYLTRNQVDLLVMIPAEKPDTSAQSWESRTYTPPVPVLTLYDNGHNDQPHRLSETSTHNSPTNSVLTRSPYDGIIRYAEPGYRPA
jgi:nucleotide-binding universal stress UspA family protein